YLDTGVKPVPEEELQKCSEWVGLPFEIMKVDLDLFRNLIKKTLACLEKEKDSFSPSIKQADPTVTFMMLELVSNILSAADSLPALCAHLVGQLREFTGAKLVVLLQCHHGEKGSYKVLRVNPERRRTIVDDPLFAQLVDEVYDCSEVTLWDLEKEACRAAKIVFSLGFGDMSAAVSLDAGDERVGAVLLIGLPDRKTVGSIIEPLTTLGQVAGLAFSKAVLIADQDMVITERTSELQESAHFLAQAQQLGKIGSWRLDLQENNLYWSEENYRIFGLEQGTSLTYEIFLNCVHPDDRDYVDKKWKAALSGEPYDIEHRLLVDGKVKWVKEKAEIKFDENGTAVSGAGFAQDITERRTAEEERKNIEERFKSIFNQSLQFALILDKEGTILDMNKLYVEVCGSMAYESYGKPIWEALWWKDFADVCESTKAAVNKVQQGETVDDEMVFIDKDNVKHNGMRIFSPIKDESGSLSFISVVGRDITERKKAEEAVRESEERFRGYFELGMIGMAITSLDKYWVEFNDELCDMFGYTREEFEKLTWAELTHPEDIEEDEANFNKVLDGKSEGYSMSKRFIHKEFICCSCI
ncbi:MAG: PAS domain-containing protein, partial [Planctomycetota bacterium]